MLFEEVILTKPASQMYLYHTMKWPLHYDGHPSNNTQTAYCSFIRNGIFSDPSCCVPCSVHNEFLIYLFYGRPAYRWNTFSPFPVLFVFSINATTLPYMIYPFDSGAFGKRYGNAYSSKSLSTYSVYKDGNGISLDKIPSLIEAIWTSQVNYYTQRRWRGRLLPAPNPFCNTPDPSPKRQTDRHRTDNTHLLFAKPHHSRPVRRDWKTGKSGIRSGPIGFPAGWLQRWRTSVPRSSACPVLRRSPSTRTAGTGTGSAGSQRSFSFSFPPSRPIHG